MEAALAARTVGELAVLTAELSTGTARVRALGRVSGRLTGVADAAGGRGGRAPRRFGR
ncbi:hypothetical protein ACWD0J_30200 [Streptomyces sp. NPDC003011]